MTDDPIQPRRRRRSSISERIQRALHGDRSDKVRRTLMLTRPVKLTGLQKRQSLSPGEGQNGFQLGQTAQFPAQVQPGDDTRMPLAEAPAGHRTSASYSLQDETLPSTLTYSSQDSRLPSTYTPGSSPSVRPAHTATPDQTKSEDKNGIYSAPTWKETTRKERRATKRLEAERKELEKRLMKLEESQARLQNGIHERQSRRLTKKKPLDNSKRSSSTSSERPRSSRSLSAFFSSSRRSSRSRASSANADDRRQSSDQENPGGGPPTLPLSLPERFGTAVSRELASRHGPSLMPNHQLRHSSHFLHHPAAKSDDLRENWKMAEAWQKQNREREVSDSLAGVKKEMGVVGAGAGAGAQSALEKRDDRLAYPSLINPPIDLDREQFTANLRQERKPAEIQRPATPSTFSTLQPADLSTSQSTGSPPIRVTTAPQFHNVSHGENQRSSPVTYPPASLKEMRKGKLVTKDVPDFGPHAHHKEYKSSPLALNPVTTDDITPKKENEEPPKSAAAEQSTRGLVPPPLRINFEFARGRGRQVSYPSTSGIPQGRSRQDTRQDRASLMGPLEMSAGSLKRRWNPKPIAFDKPKPTAWELRPPPAIIPPFKHPGRKYALAENSPYGRLSDDGPQTPPIMSTDAVPVTRSQESMPQVRHPLAEMPASKSTPNVIAVRGRSRSSSRASISSYDTADEEVLDTPNHHPERRNNPSTPKSHETNHSSALSTTPPKSPATNRTQTTHPSPSPRGNRHPPHAPDGMLSVKRHNKFQEPAKLLRKDQRVAKVFVICCHCQYWHDPPSELYAKLASPERIPSESRPVSTFSRNNTPGRRGSIRRAVFGGGISTDAAAKRLPGGKQGLNTNGMHLISGGAGVAAGTGLTEMDHSAAAHSAPLSCCWCGHEMSRLCCQGWTTLVQMRERHH
ncbi:hypothetical protein F1880_001989 [Penicillium rolfsii]|nr:hypothetical protein F1880_001989 [Penicillium rolfsii]